MYVNRAVILMSGLWLCIGVLSATSCKTTATSIQPSANKAKDQKSEIASTTTQVVRLGDAPFQDYARPPILKFINEKDGWLAADTQLWRTRNGGESWELVFTSQAELDFVSEINFINAKIGWIAVFNKIYKTEDGGVTWAQKPSPFTDGFILSLGFQADGKRGWVAGDLKRRQKHKPSSADSPGTDDYSDAIFLTEDGGESWQQQPTPSTTSITVWYWFDAEHGWAFGDNIFSWKNGKWARVNNFEAKCDNHQFLNNLSEEHAWPSYPIAAYFLNSQEGWISYTSGYMAKTTDGGRTWCDLLNPRNVWPTEGLDTYFKKIYFNDATRGWGYDDGGKLYTTNDGGVTWSKINTNARFDGIYFVDGENVRGVSKEGLFRIKL